MATFYVVPSRQLLGLRFGEMLMAMFPDSQPSPWQWPELSAMLTSFVEGQGNAYVVFREDLDEGLSVKDSLVRHFGAALDDEIVEVHFGAALYQVLHQCWSNEGLKQAA